VRAPFNRQGGDGGDGSMAPSKVGRRERWECSMMIRGGRRSWLVVNRGWCCC
jgi:hypothetical protein